MKTTEDPLPAPRLSVQYAVSGYGQPSRPQVRALVQAACAASRCSGEVGVRFVDEREGGALNAQYRGKTRPTNVLSFDYRPGGQGGLLGDIVICSAVVCREAAQHAVSRYARYAHMIVHGVLHLAGYRHDDTAQAEQMESKEAEILRQFNIADPYR